MLILEKAPEIGGTTRKAAFWYWVPNNQAMRDKGMEDPREDCLRYMARLSRPECYNPNDEQSGHAGLGVPRCSRRSTTMPRPPPSS